MVINRRDYITGMTWTFAGTRRRRMLFHRTGKPVRSSPESIMIM